MRLPQFSVACFAAGLLILISGCGKTPDEEAPARPEIDPTSVVAPEAAALLLRGQERFEAGDPGRALALLDSAEHRVAPDRAAFLADLYFLRARIQTSINRDDLAKPAYERVLALKPGYKGASRNLGNVAYRDGKYSEAISRYRQEQETYPSPEHLVMIGRSYAEMGQVDSALTAYDEAIALDAHSAEAYIRLAELHDKNGDPDAALQSALKATEYEPENIDYALYTGSLWMRAGDPASAVPVFEQVLAKQPYRQEAHYNLGQAFARLGRKDEAEVHLAAADSLLRVERELAQWETLTQVDPESPSAWATYAYALQYLGRDAEALRAYGVALHLDPENNDARFAIANLSLQAKNFERALEEYESVLDRDPKYVDAWVNMGIALARTGQKEAARRAWQKALQYKPNQPRVKEYLANLNGS